MADNEIPELTDQQWARIWAASSDMNEMATRLRAGTATPEDVAGALNRLLSTEDNPDALHIPPDASIYAAPLERILRRIPNGWGAGSATTPAGTRSASPATTNWRRLTPITLCTKSKKSSGHCVTTVGRAMPADLSYCSSSLRSPTTPSELRLSRASDAASQASCTDAHTG
jgi:hypothetical protein